MISSPEEQDALVDEEVLVQLLQREAAMRVSPQTQKAMEEAEDSEHVDWMVVIGDLQRRIVEEHNTSSPENVVSLLDLRLAAQRHPEIAFWVKYNRARQGTLKSGDPAPDVPLVAAVDGAPTTLLASASTNKPVVCVAGSIS